MKRNFNYTLFLKGTPFGFAQNFYTQTTIINVLSAVIKFLTFILVLHVFNGITVSISAYFVPVAVCLLESCIVFIFYGKMRFVAMEQSNYYKEDIVYQAFAGLQSRRVFVAKYRLYTNIFLSIFVIATIIVTLVMRSHDSIGEYLDLFCSITVLFLLFFDGLYALRLYSLDKNFKKEFFKEINAKYWQWRKSERENNVNSGTPLKKSKLKNFNTKNLAFKNLYSLKNSVFNSVDEFLEALKLVANNKNLFVTATAIRNLLNYCPNCFDKNTVSSKMQILHCDNCGAKLKLLPYLKLQSVEGKVDFNKSLYEILLAEQDYVINLVKSGKYIFNERCNLYFKDSNTKIYLSEGNLMQDKGCLTFISDDGFRLEFDLLQSRGLTFKLNEGLYLSNNNIDYVLQLFDEAELLKLSFSLKEYQQ